MEIEYNIEDEIKDISHGKPHVVILGSGASFACCPEGDLNGKKLPTMSNLVRVTKLESLLKQYGINFENKDFEKIYSDLYTNGKNRELLVELEKIIFDYFRTLELPPYPTIYDHLVLSLRKKDLIATFNWDPLLYLACWRNHKQADLPHIVYLHGNVTIGYCAECRTKGYRSYSCLKCNKPYLNSKILFPIKEKEYYGMDLLIETEWDTLTAYLKQAYMLTIFGYSAPKSDIKAIEIMKQAWGRVEERNLEEIEIIDIKSEKDLLQTWSSFIHTHHYQIFDNFYSSWIARHPRRTCETMWQQLMECQFLNDNPFPKTAQFFELWKWYKPYVDVENEKDTAPNSVLS